MTKQEPGRRAVVGDALLAVVMAAVLLFGVSCLYMAIAYHGWPVWSVVAKSPPYPVPWFVEHVQLGSADLPSGVSMELIPQDPPEPADASIIIRNPSSTPLYVIGQHFFAHPDEYADIGVTLPHGTGPLNEIVDGRAYKWDGDLNPSRSSVDFAWVPENHPREADSVQLWRRLDTNEISSTEGSVVTLRPLNQFGPGRPADVKVPELQNAMMRLVYGVQELKIPVSVSYMLNANFPADSSSSPLGLSQPAWTCLGIAGLYVVLAGVIWYMLRRGHNARSA